MQRLFKTLVLSGLAIAVTACSSQPAPTIDSARVANSTPQTVLTKAPSSEANKQQGSNSSRSQIANVKKFGSGSFFSCAVTMTDGVQCWGQNKFGQLGNGTKTDQHLPGDVTGLKSGIEEIAVGASHACALTSVGKVMCWGNNHYGGVGDGTQIDRETPVEVAAITDVKHIAAGSSHTCALTDQGGVYCWGWSSSAVAFGDPETGAPRLIKGLDKGVQAIALGGDFACVLTDEGGVKCWGNIEVDQPDPGFTTSSDKPQNVTGLTSDVVAISAGDAFACALTRTGTVKCWGDNENGQLGNGSVIDKL